MPDAESESLAGLRRIYDRHVETLTNIDEKAMRTARTAVLILGFVVAALTTTRPSAVSDLSAAVFVLGGLSVLVLLLSSFVSVGIYTVSRYPVELQARDLRAVGRVPDDDWTEGARGTLRSAITELNEEVMQNAQYLELAQSLLIVGTAGLAGATSMTVFHRGYGVKPTHQVVFAVVVTAVLLLVLKLKSLSG